MVNYKENIVKDKHLRKYEISMNQIGHCHGELVEPCSAGNALSFDKLRMTTFDKLRMTTQEEILIEFKITKEKFANVLISQFAN